MRQTRRESAWVSKHLSCAWTHLQKHNEVLINSDGHLILADVRLMLQDFPLIVAVTTSFHALRECLFVFIRDTQLTDVVDQAFHAQIARPWRCLAGLLLLAADLK